MWRRSAMAAIELTEQRFQPVLLEKKGNTRMSSDLTGKIALITGGSRGIGAAIVGRFVRDRASIAFTYASSDEKARALADEAEAQGGVALAIKADSSDP